jgi:hypothetical protein
MTPRTRAVVGGVVAGVGLAALALALLVTWGGGGGAPGEEEGAAGPGAASEEPSGDAAGSTPDDASPASPLVSTRPVTIYRRADSERLALEAGTGQIVWYGSPVDRARQIVRLVLSGVDEGEDGAGAPPVVEGVRCEEVYVDGRGVAWVDLESASLDRVRGSDEEQALVACIARSLVEALDEVTRVGFLVDGEPRRTLAGHLDLSRTFTGAEWPLADEEVSSKERPSPSAEASSA